jgi:DNA-binding NarL/FixJ family response regulator
MSTDVFSALVEDPHRADAAHRTARLVGETLAAVAACSGWISVDIVSREPLAEGGVVRPELLQLAAFELCRAGRDESPRRLRAGGSYGDVLSLRVRAPGDIRVLVLLARLPEEPRFDARVVSEAQAKVEQIQSGLPSGADNVIESLPSIRRRSRISALIVKRNLEVVSMSLADGRLTVLEDRFPRLSDDLEAAVREAIAGWPSDFTGGAQEVVVPLGGVVVRIVPMLGEAGDLIGVFWEGARTTEQIEEPTAARYAISKRELEVARLLIKGLQGEEVANELGIAETTVAAHVRSIMTKTGSRNRTEAIAKLLAR